MLSKGVRERGWPPPISRVTYPYQIGDYVAIVPDPSHHKGISWPVARKFYGKTGKIIDKVGRAYVVLIRDGGKYKKIFVTPEHLKPVKTAYQETLKAQQQASEKSKSA